MDFDTSDDVFITPKPTRLIQRILQIATDKDSIILDNFAGSGTTAHAVLKQNAEDGGKRRFILVEMDEGIARNVTAERVRQIEVRAFEKVQKAVRNRIAAMEQPSAEREAASPVH